MLALLAQQRDSIYVKTRFGPGYRCATKFFRQTATGRMDFSPRFVLSSNSAYSRKCICANPGSGQFFQILLVGTGDGVFLAILKTKAVLARGPGLDLVHL